MKKYSVLKLIYLHGSEITPKEIATKLNMLMPNVYVYLKSLEKEKLIVKIEGKYTYYKPSKKPNQIMNLMAMAPEHFHFFITPKFKQVLLKLSKKLKTHHKELSYSDIKIIEEDALQKRIVLKISNRPIIYTLKINEAIVETLLGYHGLKPKFDLRDFDNLIGTLTLKKPDNRPTQTTSEPQIIKMCDEAYVNQTDIEIMKKTVSLDLRLEQLLKTAEQTNKEYFLFLVALPHEVGVGIRQQWERKYVYNTNSIEGNTMSQKEVDDAFRDEIQTSRISKREMHETNNMRRALQFMKIKKDEKISEDFIKEIHFLIQTDIDANPGVYKTIYNYVKPMSPTTPPQYVSERMKMLVEWLETNKKKYHPFVLASLFHMQFEIIHPFADGNGRVGRLLLNHLLEQNGYLPLTIFEKTKQNYYRALENRSIQQFLEYALITFIEDYKR